MGTKLANYSHYLFLCYLTMLDAAELHSKLTGNVVCLKTLFDLAFSRLQNLPGTLQGEKKNDHKRVEV